MKQPSKKLDELIEYMEACALIARNAADIHNQSKELRHHADMVTAVVDALQRAAQLPISDDARDAARWRALIGCGRVRVLGSAGVRKPSPTGYAHIGVEFWTHHETPTDPASIDDLIAFTERAAAGAAQPQIADDIEQRARARFLEVHGLPARDPWEHAPSATRREYLKWARNNTPAKGESP